MKRNVIEGKCERLRQKVDSIRIKQGFEVLTDDKNFQKLQRVAENVGKTSKMIQKHKQKSMLSLNDFNAIIQNARAHKADLIDYLTDLRNSDEWAHYKIKMKRPNIQYYTLMGKYELISKEILKQRVKKIIAVKKNFSIF